MNIFGLLMQTFGKILFMDGYLKNSGLSVAANFSDSLNEIRLVIGKYRFDRVTL